MFHPTRGGTRGGQGDFKWTDVANDKDREFYLGHSLKAPVGRWQNGKDLTWYNKDKGDDAAEQERLRREELRKIKEAEEDALAEALGFAPTPRPPASASTSAAPAVDPNQAILEKARRKAERHAEKEERRAERERRRAERSAPKEDRRDRERSRPYDSPHADARGERHLRDRSRSPVRPRGYDDHGRGSREPVSHDDGRRGNDHGERSRRPREDGDVGRSDCRHRDRRRLRDESETSGPRGARLGGDDRRRSTPDRSRY